MGLFKNIKEKIQTIIQRAKTPRLQAGNDYKQNNYNQPIQVTLPNGAGTLMITNIQFERQYEYANGINTNLMIANFYHIENQNAIINGNLEHVAFEIREGQSIDEVILDKIGKYYVYEKNMPDNKSCIYLGHLSQDPYELGTNNKNMYVQEYVNQELSYRFDVEKEQARQNVLESQRESMERHNREAQNYRDRLKQEHELYQIQQQNIKQQRIQNPYLEPKDNSLRNFDGINMYNGEILRLRQMNKIGKDDNGTYLYTGYVQSTPNEHDVEYLNQNGKPMGRPVCFATDKKIEEIMQSNNPNDLINFLSMLSNEQNDNGYLNYVGKIDMYGRNDPNIANTSSQIQTAVNKLKNQFYNEKISEVQQKNQTERTE